MLHGNALYKFNTDIDIDVLICVRMAYIRQSHVQFEFSSILNIQ